MKMKEVVLVGDSIRMWYQQYVQRELEGFAQVWGPEENGGTSQNLLSHLEEWVLSRDPDVVHINAGLHDIRRPPDLTTHRVPLEQYRRNVRELLRTIQMKTRARLIWATTTPVNEYRHKDDPDKIRRNPRFPADVVTYNETALELARSLGVEVNDLYQVAIRAGQEDVLSPDGVHFTDEGSALLGKAVADFIRGNRR